ncbi:hypothetical protein NDU88_005043 [Pleurodeles waltl]|uniref:Uncharacterized protein n=1 Tax=Pleurodeles waltl TaxID=8319 RepID=A0AAV7TTQ6_PLEWA|nr:hypothetical protein NDU88_005043 [Pleurodeles waltl]
MVPFGAESAERTQAAFPERGSARRRGGPTGAPKRSGEERTTRAWGSVPPDGAGVSGPSAGRQRKPAAKRRGLGREGAPGPWSEPCPGACYPVPDLGRGGAGGCGRTEALSARGPAVSGVVAQSGAALALTGSWLERGAPQEGSDIWRGGEPCRTPGAVGPREGAVDCGAEPVRGRGRPAPGAPGRSRRRSPGPGATPVPPEECERPGGPQGRRLCTHPWDPLPYG